MLGGWQISGITTFQSGLPFNVTYRDNNADRDVGASAGWTTRQAHARGAGGDAARFTAGLSNSILWHAGHALVERGIVRREAVDQLSVG